jgi:methylthioribose-1-phosphate isomerase
MPRPPNIRWIGDAHGHLQLLDQRQLPGSIVQLSLTEPTAVFHAIKTLAVRGAPAIGIAAAYGLVLAAAHICDGEIKIESAIGRLREAGDYLKSSRPTAVNLAWAVDRVIQVVERSTPQSPKEIPDRLLAEARAIHAEDAQMCSAMARHGASLIRPNTGVLTHCNAGYLATGGDGTSLAVIYEAHRLGTPFVVYADETRPLLQGARLTAWELQQENIPVTLITDSTAAVLMAQGKIQLAIVGADRIAANGDTANKIGTYSVATLCRAHDIPFVVAAPSSTFDLSLAEGSMIPIEERSPQEITHGFGTQTGPDGVAVYNPAFDVTPARLIHAIVTERGVINPVSEGNIRSMLSNNHAESLGAPLSSRGTRGAGTGAC